MEQNVKTKHILRETKSVTKENKNGDGSILGVGLLAIKSTAKIWCLQLMKCTSYMPKNNLTANE